MRRRRLSDPAALQACVREWQRRGDAVALVPTMGNLHAGHYSLLELARAACERVVVSVFVNPTQFGPDEDFERYPRSLEADAEGLAQHGCDLLFTPTVAAMYPYGLEAGVRVHVPEIGAMLEGERRPGHFDGVATVVTKLLAMVQPQVAVFGRKDYQQLRLIERLCADLGMPVRIVPAPIARAADGLALSSRNQYLDAKQRALAPRLHASLCELRRRVRAGAPIQEAEAEACAGLVEAGFAVDYVAVRNAADLAVPAADQRAALVALAAARLGATRLIDNLEID